MGIADSYLLRNIANDTKGSLEVTRRDRTNTIRSLLIREISDKNIASRCLRA